MPDIFDKLAEKKNAPDIFDRLAKPQTPDQPVSLRGAAEAYGSGLAGGAGGLPQDIINLVKPAQQISPTVKALSDLSNQMGLKGTQELTESIQPQSPQNSVERILQKAGEFGGQEAIIGTLTGGPVGGALGGVHGSISGTFYGAAKELGASDEVALLAALATLSPIAAERLITKLTKSKAAQSALKGEVKAVQEGVAESGAPPPPPSPPPGGIAPGAELPTGGRSESLRQQALEAIHERPQTKPLGIEAEVATKTEAPSLQGRVSPAKEIGEIISKEPFHSEAQAGRTISKEVQELRNSEKEIVRDKYKQAEEITEKHNDIFPEEAKKNDERIAKYEKIEKRSAGEEAVYQDALALRRIIGTTDGLIEANAGQLMKQANSFSQKVNYELPYAGYKGQIKEIVHDINKGVIESLRKAGLDFSTVVDADKTFGRFADRFMNDEISAYLARKNLNPEELAKKAVSDPAAYRAVKAALGERKSPLMAKIDRELIHQKMDKYYKNPELVGSKDYARDLTNLAERVGKQRIADVDHFLRQRQLNFERKLVAENKLRETQLALEAAKKAPAKSLSERLSKGEVPTKLEDIDRAFRTKSSIRELRDSLKRAGKEKAYEALRDEKVTELFKEGKYGGKKLTGKDIVDTIDKHHEILEELLGKQEVSELYKVGELAYGEELTQALLEKYLKKVGKAILTTMGLGKIVKFLPLAR